MIVSSCMASALSMKDWSVNMAPALAGMLDQPLAFISSLHISFNYRR